MLSLLPVLTVRALGAPVTIRLRWTDVNRDGRPDLWQHHNDGGALIRGIGDTNFDRIPAKRIGTGRLDITARPEVEVHALRPPALCERGKRLRGTLSLDYRGYRTVHQAIFWPKNRQPGCTYRINETQLERKSDVTRS